MKLNCLIENKFYWILHPNNRFYAIFVYWHNNKSIIGTASLMSIFNLEQKLKVLSNV